MVTRASSVPQLNNSSGGSSSGSYKGSSGSRGRVSNTKVRRSTGGKSVTPTSRDHQQNVAMLPRSRSLINGMRRVSPQKSTGGSSGSRNTPVFLRSRENEIGSADTLEIVASKSAGTGSEPSTPEDNINVVVRVRPLNEKEKRDRHGSILQFPGNGQIIIEAHSSAKNRNRENVRVFTYNVVFEPGATQDDILDYSGIKRIIEMAIEGFSCTAFCYGQTGSGKTHTLTGPPDLFIGKPNHKDPRHGLIFRSFVYLFQLIKNRKDISFVLKASFMEIYNERVIDLLNPGSQRKPLSVRWSKKSGGFFVENLFTVDCEELDDLLAVLEEGMRNRAVGSHAMNDHSSRSHTILTVHIISEQQTDGGVFLSKHGKINFVDLAGSELTKKTMSEGKTLEEANNINKSLMVLGYCIASLSDNKKRFGHIPYRDSQLTKLLADSLAGNGVTLMIACVSPANYNYAETLNTLRYASRAKRIRTKPVIMMDPREALILSLKRDINALQMENEHLKAALNYHHNTIKEASITVEDPDLPEIPTDHGGPIPKINLERLPELDGSELAELVKLYMQENEALRQENNHLFTVRETILRDQEIVCRENERLLKKLEDVNKYVIPERVSCQLRTNRNLPEIPTDHGGPIPKINLERLPELDGSELAELVKLYMQENEALRQENNHLFTVRETILRDQEIVCRENERLLKKLEDVNKVCVRSPLIPARPALSSASGSETPGTEIWTNPQDSQDERDPSDLQGRISENNEKRSDAEQRKIDQDRIARNIIDMANNFPRRHLEEHHDEGTNTAVAANPEDINTDVNGFLPDMLT